MKNKLTLLLFVLLSALFIYLHWTIFDKKIDANGDDSCYYLLAKSLSQGNGFTMPCDVAHQPHNHFPVGYPLVMALFMKINASLQFMKILNGLFLWGILLLIYLIQVRLTGNRLLALPTLLLCLVNYHLLKYSILTMSEMPYTFVSMLSLYLFLLLWKKEKVFQDYRFYLLILISTLTLYIRTAGLSLIVALTVAFIVGKQYKIALVYFASSLLLYSPWILRAKFLHLHNPYLSAFLSKNPYDASLGQIEPYDLWLRFLENIDRYVGMEIPEALFPYLTIGYDQNQNALQEYGIGVVCVVLFLFYLVKNFRTAHLLVVLYVICTYGIILLWPTQWFGVRFMLPLVPLLYMALLIGVSQLLDLLFKKHQSTVTQYGVLVLSFFLCAFAIKKHKKSDPNTRHCISYLIKEAKDVYAPAYSNFYKVAEYCKANLPDSAIVSSRKPAMFAYFSEGYTTSFPSSPDSALFDAHFKVVKYVVVDQFGYTSTSKCLVPYIESHSADFDLVVQYKDPDTYLFHYNK